VTTNSINDIDLLQTLQAQDSLSGRANIQRLSSQIARYYFLLKKYEGTQNETEEPQVIQSE